LGDVNGAKLGTATLALLTCYCNRLVVQNSQPFLTKLGQKRQERRSQPISWGLHLS
jgi:hypothetical protein